MKILIKNKLPGSTLIEVIISLVITSIISTIMIVFIHGVFFTPKEITSLKTQIILNNIKNEIKVNSLPIEIIIDNIRNQYPEFSIDLNTSIENGQIKSNIVIKYEQRQLLQESIIISNIQNTNL